MDFGRLFDNIVSVTKESQLKLGYESVPFGINYARSSLLHLLGDCDDGAVPDLLAEFAAQYRDTLGDITYRTVSNGYRIDIPTQGVDYVHSLVRDDDFLVQFINVIRDYTCTIDDIIAVFNRHSDKVVVEHIDNDDFDYLIYFEDGQPDAFWYCIDTEDIGMTYHRFTKEDYLDFGF